MMRRIGILGGTFDPIHCGHLDAAESAVQALHLTSVFFVASCVPPHRAQPSASGYHRFAMVALAISGRSGWQASDIELREQVPSYTSATLTRFNEQGYAPGELIFIVGADAFAEIETWRDYPAILERAHFAVVSRPGWSTATLAGRLPRLASRMATPGTRDPDEQPLIFLIDAATPDISSTAIRERCAHGLSIAGLVPRTVQQHIEQHGLYARPSDGDGAGATPPDHAAGRLHDEK
jgi:nicotinate-nucleotide adenylyltransferase